MRRSFSMSEYYLIRSVTKAIAILRAFSKERPEMGVSEIARDLGFNKTVTQKLILTLLHEGLLDRDLYSRKYSLSPRILEIAGSFLNASPLLREGRKFVRALVRSTGMTGGLAILDGDEVLYLISIEANAAIKAVAQTGDRRPIHATATGKCLLAFLPKAERDNILKRLRLERLTSHTLTSMDSFLAELQITAKRGYAINQEERVVGLWGIAAPVCNRLGSGHATVGLGIPKGVVSEKEFEDMGRCTIQIGRKMSERLAGFFDVRSD